MFSPSTFVVMYGWLACWGLGGILGVCGFAIYIVRFWGRGIVKEMKADSLPVASRLIYAGARLGVIGAVLGFILIGLLARH